MTNIERLIIWPIGIVPLIMAGAVYLAWCGAVAVAAFLDWVREDRYMSHDMPGEYQVILFDRLGAKIGKRNADCCVYAMIAGREALSRGEGHSFVVAIILHNSAISNLENYDVRLLSRRG